MFDEILKLYKLLPDPLRKKFIFLQILLAFAATLEFISIGAVAPYLSYVINPSEFLMNNSFGNYLNNILIINKQNLFIYMSFSLLIIVLISCLVSLISVWSITHFTTNLGSHLSTQLLKSALAQPFEFHVKNHSSDLSKTILSETDRCVNSIIFPLILMNAKIILLIVFVSFLIFINPLTTILCTALFGVVYYSIFKFFKVKLVQNSEMSSALIGQRYRIVNNSLGIIRDVIQHHRASFFVNIYESKASNLAKIQGDNLSFMQMPKYIVEFLILVTLILSILIFTTLSGSTIDYLQGLVMIGLFSFKLLPAFQQIYGSASSIKGNLSSIEQINKNLHLPMTHMLNTNQQKKINFNSNIKLNNVKFSYNDEERVSLNINNLEIKKGSTIGIVGASGAGNSTLVDILVGLLKVKPSSLLIDDKEINKNEIVSWRKKIGYVPQRIFVSDSTIAENIAFGEMPNEIDMNKIYKVMKMANLTHVVGSHDEGVNTIIGENGIKFSGGQLQRLGLARALYMDPEVLVLDEATSALDGPTEYEIMNSIEELSYSKTIIIIAHRLSTIRHADNIFVLKDGNIECEGDYKYLSQNNNTFKELMKKQSIVTV